jgi:hypothetical protein
MDRTCDRARALNPELLRKIALEAGRPFYGCSLDRRADDAKHEWEQVAQGHSTSNSPATSRRSSRDGLAKLDALPDEIAEINDALEAATENIDLPELPPIPELEVPVGDEPLIDSD